MMKMKVWLMKFCFCETYYNTMKSTDQVYLGKLPVMCIIGGAFVRFCPEREALGLIGKGRGVADVLCESTIPKESKCRICERPTYVGNPLTM